MIWLVLFLALISLVAQNLKLHHRWNDKLTAERVARHSAEVALSLGDGRLHGLEQDNMWLKAQLDGAHTTILEMRRDGFDLPPAPPLVGEGTKDEPLPIAIRDALEGITQEGDPLFNQILRAFRGEMDAANTDEDYLAIAKSITRGSSYTPYN